MQAPRHRGILTGAAAVGHNFLPRVLPGKRSSSLPAPSVSPKDKVISISPNTDRFLLRRVRRFSGDACGGRGFLLLTFHSEVRRDRRRRDGDRDQRLPHRASRRILVLADASPRRGRAQRQRGERRTSRPRRATRSQQPPLVASPSKRRRRASRCKRRRRASRSAPAPPVSADASEPRPAPAQESTPSAKPAARTTGNGAPARKRGSPDTGTAESKPREPAEKPRDAAESKPRDVGVSRGPGARCAGECCRQPACDVRDAASPDRYVPSLRPRSPYSRGPATSLPPPALSQPRVPRILSRRWRLRHRRLRPNPTRCPQSR